MEKIDLHGVKHSDVSKILDEFFWKQMKRNAQHLQVITGNSPEMKEIVKKVVSEYGFTIHDNNFPFLTIDLV